MGEEETGDGAKSFTAAIRSLRRSSRDRKKKLAPGSASNEHKPPSALEQSAEGDATLPLLNLAFHRKKSVDYCFLTIGQAGGAWQAFTLLRASATVPVLYRGETAGKPVASS
ncbi:hypothetical protein [Paraburkholderia graminis]|uniref:Uncharacterized protein n=1 Tax=Paraburkholderia graminis TaxID=60548 RepID=A0ABD5CT06_9BURK|nr:hypothetical protein [Paraburkholderia graminis]MDR6208021.1 hypothetical protein [Paraburkholderia graminis]